MASFRTSSQLKNWMFSNDLPIREMHKRVNADYIEKQRSRFANSDTSLFLSADDEVIVKKHYEFVMRSFCADFQPPMPPYVFATAVTYFKRYYMKDSIMNYHPEEIAYTCIFLACKVEEHHISIIHFTKNIKNPMLNTDEITDIILSQELHLMSKLNYDLTIHNPFRAVKGFIVDFKHKNPSVEVNFDLATDDFVHRCLYTDIMFIYSPSQIALAALCFAAKYFNVNIEDYVLQTLCKDQNPIHFEKIKECIAGINDLLKSVPKIERAKVKKLLKEVEICRNPRHDYKSETYKELQKIESQRIEQELIEEMNME